LRIARWFASPFERSYSARVSRGVMHQHPPHAPRGPNNRSKSFQRSIVSGWTASSGARFVVMT